MSNLDNDTGYDLPQSGTITALNGVFALDPIQKDTQAVSLTGTWTATVTFEASNDGSTWFSILGFNVSTNALVSSATANGNFVLSTAGYSQSRLRASAFTSGTITVLNEGSAAVQAVFAQQPNAASLLATVSQGTNPWTIGGNGTNNTPIPSISVLIGGSDGTTLRPVAVDNQGRLVTSAITGFGADFSFGDIVSASLTKKAVQRTVYTEQTSNAQRSIASANANDTAAGTGARTVRITYLDSTGAGPFTETVTLNGTTYVNTVATNICYIEEVRVLTAGSGLVNAGILTIKAATAGGGATIGTINASDTQTFWAHHYIPTGKDCKITGISCGGSGTTVGSGGLFILSAKMLGIVNPVESQVSDFVRLYGQSSTFSRTYTSPIIVTGPARLRMYVTPETATSTTYRGAFDFFEP